MYVLYVCLYVCNRLIHKYIHKFSLTYMHSIKLYISDSERIFSCNGWLARSRGRSGCLGGAVRPGGQRRVKVRRSRHLHATYRHDMACCMYVCMFVCIYIYVCMYVCMHVCMWLSVLRLCTCIQMFPNTYFHAGNHSHKYIHRTYIIHTSYIHTYIPMYIHLHS